MEWFFFEKIFFEGSNHGKTKSVRNQKRNAIFRRKNEMCNKKASKQ